MIFPKKPNQQNIAQSGNPACLGHFEQYNISRTDNTKLLGVNSFFVRLTIEEQKDKMFGNMKRSSLQKTSTIGTMSGVVCRQVEL